MTQPHEIGTPEHEYDPLHDLFAPDARTTRDALAPIPPSAYDEIDPVMLKASDKVRVGWMPSWLLRLSVRLGLLVSKPVELISAPLTHPATDRLPWLTPLVGAVVGLFTVLKFGLFGLAIFVGAVLAFTAFAMVLAIILLPLVEELTRRDGNGTADRISELARFTIQAIEQYGRARQHGAMVLSRRRRDDVSDLDRARTETYWHNLRFSITRQAHSLDGICALVRDGEAGEATGPIVMAMAAVAEALRALVVSVNADDLGRFQATPEIEAFDGLRVQLQALDSIAREQAAPIR